jgi:hypothetical protein
MAHIVYLSEQERLELKAEIMEHHETAWGIRTPPLWSSWT